VSKSESEIRRAFLEFFRARGHEVVQSGPLVPPNDPSLMFANAGMVQFKDVFTGRERRDYKRAVTIQKCIRISGKHNDLEAVGASPRHHTFFEMLGNFSFGDYFKEEAIVFAWEFLTKDIGLSRDRLICTYFKGEGGVEADETAQKLWKKISGFGDDRVRGLGMSDNFWAMGDTGPCGPCSEIYYYNGPSVDLDAFGSEQSPDGTGWAEIWNLVFMQFERKTAGGAFDKLPAPSIDTGAGFERLTSVLQGKTSNYDTDLLRPIVELAAELSGKKYQGSDRPDDVSMRVIADHARTTAFLIAEGVTPDRTAREYVLRRVMRRAVRHGHRLGIRNPFLHRAALEVVELMGAHYPELVERRALIESVAEAEEVRFRQTLERGLTLLDERIETLEERVLPGKDAFELYDTYGFPLDLTEVICGERGIAVDVPGYDAALEQARKRSEFKSHGAAVETVYREALARVPGGSVKFTGYERTEDSSKIAAIVKDGALAESAKEGDAAELVALSTPFYGEAGGQVGDTGTIETASGAFQVEDTQKPVAGIVVHRGRVVRGTLRTGEEASLKVDVSRRDRIRKNHSATHLLHWALRQVLGSQAQQKGSVVGPDRLRFDFTYGSQVLPEQIAKVEDLVNERILKNLPVETNVMTMSEARSKGATMIFEEKYGDVVRMLGMGESLELCGGTHVRATGDIGLFKILGEQGIAAGVRRIFATTGDGSLTYVRELEGTIDRASRAAKATSGQLIEKVEKLVAGERALQRRIEELERKLATGGGGGGIDALIGRAREIAGVRVLGVRSEVLDRAALRELAEQLRDRLGNSIVLVGSAADDKAQLVLTVAKPLVGRYKAGDLIRPIAAIVGGSGGGRPDMAQAGGTEVGRLDQAIEAVYESVATSAS
jgi:alanyl-tRNA synthetase